MDGAFIAVEQPRPREDQRGGRSGAQSHATPGQAAQPCVEFAIAVLERIDSGNHDQCVDVGAVFELACRGKLDSVARAKKAASRRGLFCSRG